MNVLNYLKRPEYLWRPRQVIRRFLRIGRKSSGMEEIQLPWGTPLRVRVGENVGADIYYYGIFDLIVPEAIWRLLDPGETAFDIGANIGQNTSAMAVRSGAGGTVLAFEPHPEIFDELVRNRKNWTSPALAHIRLEQIALGDERAEAILGAGHDFTTNRGSAHLITDPGEASVDQSFAVTVDTLDSHCENIDSVGVCKIDVEGHELAVLRGAQKSLSRRLIRDVIFEDFNVMPSPVVELLQGNGFEVFRLMVKPWKPSLKPLSQELAEKERFSHNYLATLAPARARARFRAVGWRCLMRP